MNNNTMRIGVVFVILLIGYVFGQNAGYQIGKIKDTKLLRQYANSKYYQIQCDEIKDSRPIKLLELVGSHYQVGYAYGAIIGPEIIDTYHTFIGSAFSKKWQKQLLQIFLDWQYDNILQKQVPKQYKNQLKGIGDACKKIHHNGKVRKMIERTLVISSYPGDFGPDVFYTLFDEFLRLGLHNEKLINLVENNLFATMKKFHKFFLQRAIHCSFFATWGKRTQGMKLFTMRNLDWHANTGINKNKIIFVWKVHGTVPHTTLGFPGIIGALTGMSAAGLTVHQAGLDSMKATQFGFQWSLRLRYILMHAINLQQARQIWKKSNNTLGMNHMVASASDLATGQPVFVVETMRNYTAWFVDNDKREKGTIFIDPTTHEKFQAGFAMQQAVFRTNHAYDPQINKYRTKLPSKATSTVKRYFVLKDDFLFYQKNNKKITQIEAVNITANVAHKGSENPYICPAGKDNGTNVISVTYVPADLKMFAGFQYGAGENYKTACCGVYLEIDMSPWFQIAGDNLKEQIEIMIE